MIIIVIDRTGTSFILIKDLNSFSLLIRQLPKRYQMKQLLLRLINKEATHDKDFTVGSDTSDAFVVEKILSIFVHLFFVKFEW